MNTSLIDSVTNWFSVISLTTFRCTFENVFGWLHFWRRGLCVCVCVCVHTRVCVCPCVCISLPCLLYIVRIPSSLPLCRQPELLQGMCASHWQLGSPPLMAPCLFNPPPDVCPLNPSACAVPSGSMKGPGPQTQWGCLTVLALNNFIGLSSHSARNLEDSWALSRTHIHSQ